MANSTCKLGTQSRKAGQSAVAKAAYDSCSCLRANDGKNHCYSKKDGLFHKSLIFAEGVKPCTRGQYWRKVEKAETRSDALLSRSIIFALPKELSQTQQIALAEDLAHTLMAELKLEAIDICLHNPHKLNRRISADPDSENPHGHIHFASRNKNGEKMRQFNGPQLKKTTQKIQFLFVDITNKHLEAAGSAARLSKETFLKRSKKLKKAKEELEVLETQKAAIEAELTALEAEISANMTEESTNKEEKNNATKPTKRPERNNELRHPSADSTNQPTERSAKQDDFQNKSERPTESGRAATNPDRTDRDDHQLITQLSQQIASIMLQKAESAKNLGETLNEELNSIKSRLDTIEKFLDL